jgi:hypothetical protein
MALDLDAIRSKLNKLEKTTTRQNILWKPSPGESMVRLVPYQHGNDPFVELYFCYNIGKVRTILSPVTFGKDCPINEATTNLRATGNKEDFELARKISPKLRIYAPVVVRGKESEGVKFYGFGKTVYQTMLNYFLDADYGDLSHATKGRDITIKYTAPNSANTYGSTEIRPKPNQTPLMESVDEAKKLIESVPHINEIFEEKSYEDVEKVWQAFLNENENPEEPNKTLGTEKDFNNTATTVTTPAVASTPAKGEESLKNLDSQFDDIFKS